jgi:hypothetical protein
MPKECADATAVPRKPQTALSARWFEEGSSFRESLEASLRDVLLDFGVRTFCWSGANSVYARDVAAEQLAALLKRDLGQSSAATAIVIAHSHGGNVALRAMTYLGVEASRVKLVTLATPFLRVFVRTSLVLPFTASLLLWGAIVSVLGSFLVAGIMLAMNSFANPTDRPSPFWLLGGVVAAAVVSLPINRRLVGLFVDGWNGRPLKIGNAAAYDTRGTSVPRMLVIRGVDDEAALFLAAGSIGSRLSHILLFHTIPFTYVAAPLLVFTLGWLFATEKVTSNLLLLIVFATCSLGAFACLLLPGLCKSAFGREFTIGAMRCDIAADSVPDASERIEVITLAPEAARWMQHPQLGAATKRRQKRNEARLTLRHGIYSHPHCVSEIVAWLRRII